MSKFKVGDKVRIANKRGKHWNFDGEMDYWMGKVVTIRDVICETGYRIKEDGNEYIGFGWCWYDGDFTLVEDNNQSVHIYTNGNTTTAVLKKGKEVVKTATAKCAPSDEFNFKTGAELTFSRLFKSEVKEVKRAARVGEWVKSLIQEKGGIKEGGIYQVISVCPGLKQNIYVKSPAHSDFDGSCTNDSINQPFSYLCEHEYVVLENYQQPVEPEPEPEYYNGKVVCVKGSHIFNNLTVGKVYIIDQGVLTDEDGHTIPKIKSVEDLNGRGTPQFIEYKREASKEKSSD